MEIKPNGLQTALKNISHPDVSSWKPEIFNLSKSSDYEKFSRLLAEKKDTLVFHNELESQLKELFKIRHPKKKLKSDVQEKLYQNWLTENDFDTYGLYVYYPWNSKIIHIVTEAEYVELRTSRNKYKITEEEQGKLASKTVGVIGLSVGQSVAVTMAIERILGTIRLADFDHLELTNLNRIRTGLHSLGLSKTILVAREIAEIDPFIKVELFPEGISEKNIGAFLGEGDIKLDMLVEECDSLDIKVLARLEARKRQIPVIMDTSDRGMIDIERFDLEPDRDILHGRIKIDNVESLKTLSYEEKIPFILEMVGAENMSPRLKSSMLEVEQTLSSWPQLAGDVAMGGAICTELVREAMLGHQLNSGRFYIDPFDIINADAKAKETEERKTRSLDIETELAKASIESGEALDEKQWDELVKVAMLAPSAGNVQPWKFHISDSVFYIFLDPNRIEFFGDFKRFASLLSVGGVIENLRQRASRFGYDLDSSVYPNGKNSFLAAAIRFKKSGIPQKELDSFVESRHTNRNMEPKKTIPQGFVSDIQKLNQKENKNGLLLSLFEQEQDIEKIGEFVAKADVQRLLYKYGHKGFYHEIRWGDKEARETGDGIDIETVEVSDAELAGFSIARDWQAVELLSEMNLGSAFGRLSKKQIDSSSALIHISAKDFGPEAFVEGGKLMEKVWLLAEKHKLGFHPLLSTCLFFNQYRNGGKHYMPENMQQTLAEMEPDYLQVFPWMNEYKTEIFLARLFVPQREVKKAYRRDKTEFLIS